MSKQRWRTSLVVINLYNYTSSESSTSRSCEPTPNNTLVMYTYIYSEQRTGSLTEYPKLSRGDLCYSPHSANACTSKKATEVSYSRNQKQNMKYVTQFLHMFLLAHRNFCFSQPRFMSSSSQVREKEWGNSLSLSLPSISRSLFLTSVTVLITLRNVPH
jgi:hypothetical protein